MSLAPVVCDPCEQELPPFPEETCSWAFKGGEISRLLIKKKGHPFIDFEDATEHTTNQSQTATGDDAIRNVRFIGGLTYAQGDKQEWGTYGTTYGPKKMTLTGKILDFTDEMYQAMRTFGCDGQVTVWPLTSFGQIIGGNDGIDVVLSALPNYPESNKEKVFFQIGFEKDVTILPEVGTYPLDMNL